MSIAKGSFTAREQSWPPVLNTCVIFVYSNESLRSARTDWAPTVLVSLQPIKSWRWRAWPINASYTVTGSTCCKSIQFTCCERALTPWPTVLYSLWSGDWLTWANGSYGTTNGTHQLSITGLQKQWDRPGSVEKRPTTALIICTRGRHGVLQRRTRVRPDPTSFLDDPIQPNQASRTNIIQHYRTAFMSLISRWHKGTRCILILPHRELIISSKLLQTLDSYIISI